MLSKLSVKKPYTVIVGIILVIVLGVISFQHMSTDLLPSMNLPYVVVYTTYPGATPEQVEGEVTRPMEASFATLTDIKKISSQSRDNVAVVIMQFNNGANMDTALIEISSKLDQLKGTWDDDVGAPVALKLNPDMLPVAILSVARDDMDILDLSKYVDDELTPAFEALNGVASVTASGVIEQEIDVTIEQSRIDVVNSAILESVDAELAKAEREINDAQAKISDGKRQLAQGRAQAYKQLDEAEQALANGETQMTGAITELTAQRDALKLQRDNLASTISAMDSAMNMTEEEKAAVREGLARLGSLKQQKAELEAKLASAQEGEGGELMTRRRSAVSRRDSLIAEQNSYLSYIEDLKLTSPEALNADITRLSEERATAQQALEDSRAELQTLIAERDGVKARVAELETELGETHPTDAPVTAQPATDRPDHTPGGEDAPTDAPEETSAVDATDAPEETPAADTTVSPEETAQPDETPDETPGEAPDETPGHTAATPAETAVQAPVEAPDETAPDEGESAPSSDETTSETPSESHEDKPAEPSDGSEGEARAVRLPGAAIAEEADREALAAELAVARERLTQLEAQVTAKQASVDQLQADADAIRDKLDAKQRALDTLSGDAENIAVRAAEAQARADALTPRIEALDQEIADIDAQLALSPDETGEIARQLSAVEQEIKALEDSGIDPSAPIPDDPEQLQAQYNQAQASLAEMDAGIEQMEATLDKLSNGIIPGGFIEGIDEDTRLTDAKQQLADARSQIASALSKAQSMLNEADEEIAKARKEFYDKRDEALEDAGIDGVITVQMVAGLIGAQNMSMPAGYVRDLDDDQVLVRVGDKFGSIDELKRMKLFNLDMDTIDEVRLLDVANVELTDNRDDVFTKLNDRDGILLSLEKQSTYSTADVADTILEKARALEAEHPELHIVDLMNQGEYIDVVVNSVLNNLLSGGGLAILILLLFLLDWRPTLTVAFSIPISVVIAFVCMYFSGITLNVLSLSGLSLGIGMLVDNSIVSIENVYRLHEEERMPPLRACVEGVRSVSGALFSSTLTTICVFLPIVFVQGMARDLFEDMGLSIAYSLLASLLVAMTVVPMMSSFLMRRSRVRQRRVFSKIQAAYGAMLRGALRVKPLVLMAAVALLVFSGMQVTKMGISFMPEVNSRQMSASYTPDSKLPVAEQKAEAATILADMLEIEGIQSIGLMDGSGSMLSSGGGFSYYIIVDETAGVRNTDIARQIEAIGDKYGAELSAQASTMDISMMTGSGISVEITGDDIEVLQSIARDVAEIARSTEGTADVDDGLEDAVPEMRIVVDKEKLIDESLTTGQVLQFIAQKLSGKTEVSKVTLNGQELAIQLIEGRNSHLKPEDIENLEIEVEKEDESKLVRIGDVSEVRNTASLSTISRASQRRMVTVSFAVADGYSDNLVSDDFAARLKEYTLPDGYHAELAGENETVMEIMDDMIWMIVIAVVLIFLIMVAQFQSFKSPIIVMFTIPLAFTGGLLALMLTKMDLSIVAMLGFLVLSGVVVNNGIVFIDCVNQLRIGGMEKRPALIEAGRQRLRPILMTAMTTILGMSTMALGQGTGAEMMQPMAVVSIGGLTYATLMTLFVVPVLYDLFNGKNMKAREIQMIREAAGMNGDEVLDDSPDTPVAPVAPASVASEETSDPAPVVPVDSAPAKAEPASPPTPVESERPAAPFPDHPDAPPVPVFAPRPPKPANPIRVRLKR